MTHWMTAADRADSVRSKKAPRQYAGRSAVAAEYVPRKKSWSAIGYDTPPKVNETLGRDEQGRV